MPHDSNQAKIGRELWDCIGGDPFPIGRIVQTKLPKFDFLLNYMHLQGKSVRNSRIDFLPMIPKKKKTDQHTFWLPSKTNSSNQ